jgi:hypothetical protein
VTTKEEWLDACLRFSRRSADLWTSDRKILRQRRVTFHDWDDSVTLDDLGYTDKKLRDLERLYLDEESREVAVQLWERLRSRGKYGSASFSTCNHLVKSGASVEEAEDKKSKHGSVQGPCMQSVVVTWIAKDQVAIDVPYRSTELFKKFPADLVFLRDLLLEPFDFSGMEVTVTCYFANVTVHPMYFVTVLPHLDDPLGEMERIKDKDPTFHRHLVTHTAHYVCPEKGKSIANHSQSLRVKDYALAAIKGRELRELQGYLRG